MIYMMDWFDPKVRLHRKQFYCLIDQTQPPLKWGRDPMSPKKVEHPPEKITGPC